MPLLGLLHYRGRIWVVYRLATEQPSNLHLYTTTTKLIAPSHWCHDGRPHSGTALETEGISTQLPIQSQHSINPGHPPEKMHNVPYIAFA